MFSLRIPITDTTVSLLSSYELKELNGCRLTGNQVLSVGWREALSPIHWEMLLPQQLPCHLCVSLSQLCRASQLAVRNRVPELTGWGQIRAVTGESGGLPLEKVLRNAAWTASLLERQKECAFWVTFIATLKVTDLAFFRQLFWEVCLSYQLPASCCRT